MKIPFGLWSRPEVGVGEFNAARTARRRRRKKLPFGAILKSHSEIDLTRSISTRSFIDGLLCNSESKLAPKIENTQKTRSEQLQTLIRAQ
jgi:hypothetical protein